jgi:hypothetical protein
MPLFDKPFDDLDESHLARLVADRESESKTIDFKRDLVGHSDGDKKEFLYDVSSFANTIGGDLVFGMDESRGVAAELTGIEGLNADVEIQRLLQIARDGIKPPIAGLNARAIPLANGRAALVLRIPRSWNPPHQVTYQKAFRFYARDTNAKYLIEVDELRSAFTGSTAIADRLRSYRADRLGRILSDDPPAPLQEGAKLVLHAVPFSAFAAGGSFPLQEAEADPRRFPTYADRAPQHLGINFDGLLATSNRDAPPTPQRAYTLVSRTGAVEAVATLYERCPLPELQARIICHAHVYVRSLAELGVSPPFAIFLSLVRAKGVRLIHDFIPQGALPEDMPCGIIDKDQLSFIETVLEDTPANEADTAVRLRLTLDHLANAAGLSAAPYFAEDGRYCGPGAESRSHNDPEPT